MSPRRKKAEKKTDRKSTTKREQSLTDRIQNLNITKSYTSLAYGVVTVVVLFILIVVGIRTFGNQENVDITDDAAVTENQENEFTVQAGQTLWDISEEVYGTGYEWERIAEANNLDNPSQIEEGMTLTIPELEEGDDLALETSPTEEEATDEAEVTEVPSPTNAPEEKPQPTATPEGDEAPGESIEGGSYTVQKGDYLWDIAVRAYGDGYKWVDIYHANMDMIQNPDLIYAGQKFTIPRDN